MSSEDVFDDYIGSDFLKAETVDESLNKNTVVDVYDGGIIFLNIETSSGTLQFVVYNAHNGYYGHSAKVIINKTILEEGIL